MVFKLIGGDGNDTIVSGSRNNLLTGGNDLDTFVFNTGSGNDTIKDFSTIEGDLLDVSGWGAASLTDLTLDDTSGTLVVSLGADSVKLQGISSASELTDADFVFL